MKAEHHCPHCGQRLPLGEWLRTQERTLWTTAELVARYGGSEEHIGRELKRLGFAMQRIRHRMLDHSLSKKRALYCVKPEAFARFSNSTPQQLRHWLWNERYNECAMRTRADVQLQHSPDLARSSLSTSERSESPKGARNRRWASFIKLI